MLKTIRNTRFEAKFKKTKAKVNSNNMISDGEVTNQINSIKRKNQAKITKSKILIKSKNHDFFLNFRNIKARPGFFTPKTRLAFIKLR